MAEFNLFYFVKYLIAVVPLAMFFGSAVHAQNENWDTYMAKFGDKPASVLVDMGLMQSAPDKRYPYLVITGPKAQTCNSKGLPAKDEIGRLEEILDGTGSFLTGVTAKVLAGTVTYNCERLNYYYVKDTFNIRNAIVRMYRRNFPDYGYVVKVKYDPEWSMYTTFLYPDEDMQNWMENDKIITKLLESGDSLDKKRAINFQLYFRTDTARSAFSEFIRSRGYKADKFLTTRNTVYPYELIVSKFGAVKMDSVNQMTKVLKEQMKKRDGFYYGWDAKLNR